ncbi:MAG: hypothetical protein R3C32_04170 [Chloroflexota bacterium]
MSDWYTADDLDDFYPSALQTYTASDGVLLGLPIHYSGFLSGYNTELFQKIGVDTPPTTWTHRRPSRRSSSPVIIPSIQPWIATDGSFAAFYFMQHLQLVGRPLFSDDRTQLGSTARRAAHLPGHRARHQEGFWDPAYRTSRTSTTRSSSSARATPRSSSRARTPVPEAGSPIDGKYGRMANGVSTPAPRGRSTAAMASASACSASSRTRARATSPPSSRPRSPSSRPRARALPTHPDLDLNDPSVQEWDAALVPVWQVQSQGSLNRWGTPTTGIPCSTTCSRGRSRASWTPRVRRQPRSRAPTRSSRSGPGLTCRPGKRMA